MHEQQAILSTTVVISHTFCMENEKNLTPRGLGVCQHDPIMQVGHGEANFTFPLCNYWASVSEPHTSELNRDFSSNIIIIIIIIIYYLSYVVPYIFDTVI